MMPWDEALRMFQHVPTERLFERLLPSIRAAGQEDGLRIMLLMLGTEEAMR